MSKNYAIIIHFMLPLTTFYRSGAHRSNVYKWDAFVTSWRFYNRAWQPQRHDRLPETSGTLWIHRGALTNQRCSLATGCGIKILIKIQNFSSMKRHLKILSVKWRPFCSRGDELTTTVNIFTTTVNIIPDDLMMSVTMASPDTKLDKFRLCLEWGRGKDFFKYNL